MVGLRSWFVVLHEPLSCSRLERVHQIHSSTKRFHVGAGYSPVWFIRIVWKAEREREGVCVAVGETYEIINGDVMNDAYVQYG